MEADGAKKGKGRLVRTVNREQHNEGVPRPEVMTRGSPRRESCSHEGVERLTAYEGEGGRTAARCRRRCGLVCGRDEWSSDVGDAGAKLKRERRSRQGQTLRHERCSGLDGAGRVYRVFANRMTAGRTAEREVQERGVVTRWRADLKTCSGGRKGDSLQLMEGATQGQRSIDSALSLAGGTTDEAQQRMSEDEAMLSLVEKPSSSVRTTHPTIEVIKNLERADEAEGDAGETAGERAQEREESPTKEEQQPNAEEEPSERTKEGGRGRGKDDGDRKGSGWGGIAMPQQHTRLGLRSRVELEVRATERIA